MTTLKVVAVFCGIILLAFESHSSGVPSCTKPCDKYLNNIFKVGHTYVYNYRAVSYSYINLTNEEHSDNTNTTLKLSAEIDLHILSPCHFVMKIYNASLHNTVDGEANYFKNFSDSLAQNEMKLHYTNGTIVEFCVVENEPAWVVNIKRGILSMLQYKLERETLNYTTVENCIWGSCKSDYTRGEVEGWKTLKRKRIYKDCLQWGGQETMNSNIFQQKYIEVLDLFKNVQICKYILGNTEQPVQVTCKERQKFHPHSSKVNMAVSNVTQYLDLDRIIIKDWQSNNTDDMFTRQNMTFIFIHRQDAVDNFNTLEEFLDKCTTMRDSEFNGKMTSHSFNALIRKATFDELRTTIVIFATRFKPHMNELVNAILRSKTPNTMRAAFYLSMMPYISHDEFITWLKSLAFMKYPNTELLTVAKDLLQIDEANLAVSGLVLNLCRSTPNCTDDENVKYLINYWDNLLKTSSTNFNQRKLTLALLAIGNTGLTNTPQYIGNIITKLSYPPMLRMIAIEAFRKMPCSMKVKYLKETFTKWTDNAEVRIAAYLALCKCPLEDDVLHHIVVSFNVEGINEVTTFMWDHLSKSKNLPDQWKENVSQIVQDSFLKAEYMTFIPNHAKYFEYRNNFTIFNTTIELSSINVYQNTLPWSSLVKFSIGLFGNDVDKFEILGRVRDVNGIIDSLFPRKNPSRDDEKYAFDNEILNNVISIENSLLKPLTSDRYLQSGLISIRLYDVDISIENPFNLSYNILEVFKQYSNMFKRTLDLESFSFTNITLQIPTSVGYMLQYNVDLISQGDINLNKFVQNYKQSEFILGLSAILSTQSKLSTTISHDAYVTKPSLSAGIVFDGQTALQGDVLVQNNKIQKFSFEVEPLLNDNSIFNVTRSFK